MWKLLTNSLAVMSNLRRQGMNVMTNFLVYGMDEDREHMIYKRGWTEVVWFGILELDTHQHSRHTIEEWILD